MSARSSTGEGRLNNGASAGVWHATGIQLELKGLTKRFRSLTAVDRLDLHVRAGEFKSVIGPNGAGKSTLFNLISGLIEPTAGRILFEGRDITRLPAHERAWRGIGRSFQITSVFPHLTVFENVRVAAQAHSGRAWSMLRRADSFPDIKATAERVVVQLGLQDRASLPADVLSHGDRRLLEIAMAIAGNPKILLLDEPTAGLSPQETAMMVDLLPTIAQGRTVLLVEHDMDVVMKLSTSIVVLARGARLAEGTPDEVQQNSAVLEAYLGGVE